MPRAPRTPTRHTGIYAVPTADGGTRYTAVWRDVDGRPRERSYRRLADAVAARSAALTDRDRGVAPTPTDRRTTVAATADAWLAGGVWRDSTRAAHLSILRAHVLPTFGHKPVASLRPSDVRRWVAGMLDAGAAPTSVTARRNVLAAVLASAVADGIVPGNVAAGVTVSRPPRTPADRAAALDVDAFAALVATLPHRIRPYALALAWTGLRPSEGAGITVDRVDMLRGTITVDRQLITREPDGSPVFGPVKTPASARVVPLPDPLRDVLAAHLAEYGRGPAGLVFTTARSGAPFVRGVRAETWARAARGLNLPPAVRGWHSLRHTYASTLLAAGTDLATVSRLLGHATVNETATTYAHVLPGRTDIARNVAADTLRIG